VKGALNWQHSVLNITYEQFIFVMVLVLGATAGSSEAQEAQEIRPLSFGRLVILNNDTPGRITVDELGNVQRTSHFAIIEAPEYGIVRLSGFPANAQLFVSAIILQPQMSASIFSPEQFTLESINTAPFININSDGTDELRFGGDIVTSGSTNMNFADATYSSAISITFNY
jgi:hypothetical protein